MSATAKVFVIDDDELIVSMLCRALKREGYETRGAEEVTGAIGKINAWSPDIVMLDVNLRDGNGLDLLNEMKERGLDLDTVMLTADDTASTAIRAIRLGAADYLTKPFDMEEVKAVLGKIIEKRRLKRELDYMKLVASKRKGRELVGQSRALVDTRRHIEMLAKARVSTVLVTGESGTGKELVARYFHQLICGDEGSADCPFIAINCGALPENLIESELFGYEKGAFTDAKTDKKGVFELAQGGSLLLDEIGEMPLHLQTKLLRVLEERTVRRLGGKRDIEINVTVIAATNRNLADAVKKGEFRSDLLYRLNAFSIYVPPLRERGDDVLELCTYFLARFSSRYNKKWIRGFSEGAKAALSAYDWPGTVREVKNVVERLVVLEAVEPGTDLISAEHLPPEIRAVRETRREPERANGSAPAEAGAFLADGQSMDEIKRSLIVSALEKTKYNRAKAAKLLQVSYDTLRYQMKKYGLG
ncbi:MAG: sigma-54-dependent Fis family transcriptional regulator [Deltaproteobacteria bacterium]|nr:sigma-54-dependent Fis family transcriptional regulator [Deltaproteobacteria bacterium]